MNAPISLRLVSFLLAAAGLLASRQLAHSQESAPGAPSPLADKLKGLNRKKASPPKKEEPPKPQEPAESGEAPPSAPPAGSEGESPPAPKPVTDTSVTFHEHIAPILWKHCADCHHPGEIGPFPLLTYADAAKRADFIAELVKARRMPPWKPAPGFGAFHDERRLNDKDIKLIEHWAGAGAPEGEAADASQPPSFSDGWKLGEPDLVLQMAEAFQVPADGPDIYRCFVIPTKLTKDTYVRGVEFRAGNRKVVHHAIMFLDSIGEARKKDADDEEPGYPSFGGPEIEPTGGLGGWTPGTTPRFQDDGVAYYVRKGSDLVLQIHYHPSGKSETDESAVGIYFAKQPAKKVVTGIAVVQPELDIPAGETRSEATATSPPLPAPVSVLAVTPHMHNLGREMKVTAKLPDKEEEVPLIWIKDWDFNWQGNYYFRQPLQLPKGTVVQVHAVYDNSAGNPKNPNDPPTPVRWGLQSSDEMCLCSLQVITEKPTDLRLIAAMPGHELGAGLGGGVPGQAAVARRTTAGKAGAGKASRRLGDLETAESPVAATADRSAKKDDPFADDGIEIPEDKKRLLGRFDTDKNGKLSRKEVNKMPSGMQAFVVRTMVNK